MKMVEEVWDSKKQVLISLEEALQRNCKKCGAKLIKEGGFVKCSKGCGQVSVKQTEKLEGEEWIVKTLAGKIMTTVAGGEDGEIATLTARVPSEIWKLIAESMYYVSSEEDMEGMCDYGGEGFRGWAVRGHKVGEILLREAEKRATAIEREEVEILNGREEKARLERQEKHRRGQEAEKLIKEIQEAFVGVEWPEGVFSLEGEEVQNPKNSINIYGGGQWWVIGKDEIWQIKNNGMDGDDWGRNNVKTGGAGAIGVRVEYSEELAEKIRRLKG